MEDKLGGVCIAAAVMMGSSGFEGEQIESGFVKLIYACANFNEEASLGVI